MVVPGCGDMTDVARPAAFLRPRARKASLPGNPVAKPAFVGRRKLGRSNTMEQHRAFVRRGV
jgi:hypothetical protein